MADRHIKFICSKNTISQEIDGETVLLDMDGENYFGLNTVGTRIWQLLPEPRSPEEIFSILILEYDVEEERLKADIAGIIEQLLTNGLVTRLKDSSDDA